MPGVRDFNPEILRPYSSSALAVNWRARRFFDHRVWQFLVLLPRWLVVGASRQPICTDHDERLLEDILQRDFNGYTSGPLFMRGVGQRGTQLEMNLHREITVLAERGRATKRYFRALRTELEQSSGEEQILILRQELVIA
jgi:hypothetical protein